MCQAAFLVIKKALQYLDNMPLMTIFVHVVPIASHIICLLCYTFILLLHSSVIDFGCALRAVFKFYIFSPLVPMHSRLIRITFCLSPPSWGDWTKNQIRNNRIFLKHYHSQRPCGLWVKVTLKVILIRMGSCQCQVASFSLCPILILWQTSHEFLQRSAPPSPQI